MTQQNFGQKEIDLGAELKKGVKSKQIKKRTTSKKASLYTTS
jgi:hypothetical protein